MVPRDFGWRCDVTRTARAIDGCAERLKICFRGATRECGPVRANSYETTLQLLRRGHECPLVHWPVVFGVTHPLALGISCAEASLSEFLANPNI